MSRHAIPAGKILCPWCLDAVVGGDLPDHFEVAHNYSTDAARASLRLLAESPEAARRRVVVAAEVPDAHALPVLDGGEPGLVRVELTVPLAWVASIHVDDPSAADEVALAVVLLGAADAGDEDAAAAMRSRVDAFAVNVGRAAQRTSDKLSVASGAMAQGFAHWIKEKSAQLAKRRGGGAQKRQSRNAKKVPAVQGRLHCCCNDGRQRSK